MRGGTTFGSAVNGKVHPRIFELRAKYTVLDVVERDKVAVNTVKLLLPRTLEDASQVLDGFDARGTTQD